MLYGKYRLFYTSCFLNYQITGLFCFQLSYRLLHFICYGFLLFCHSSPEYISRSQFSSVCLFKCMWLQDRITWMIRTAVETIPSECHVQCQCCSHVITLCCYRSDVRLEKIRHTHTNLHLWSFICNTDFQL